MKLLALLLVLSLACVAAPSDTVKVAHKDVMQSLRQQHAEATVRLNASLTAEQIRLRDAITLIEGQMQIIYAIKQDTLKVGK